MEPAGVQPIWLFWDGACGLCQRAVAWVKYRDVTNQIRAVPYQDAPRPPMTDSLARQCEHSVYIITPDGQILSAGRASLYVLGKVGFPRLAWVSGLLPFVWGVELGYWIVARNRQFFSKWLFPEK
jgi:predicted DCC family thiol-disulfide oxidoreductase YuxK